MPASEYRKLIQVSYYSVFFNITLNKLKMVWTASYKNDDRRLYTSSVIFLLVYWRRSVPCTFTLLRLVYSRSPSINAYVPAGIARRLLLSSISGSGEVEAGTLEPRIRPEVGWDRIHAPANFDGELLLASRRQTRGVQSTGLAAACTATRR